MTGSVPIELLQRFLQATPEQQAAIARMLADKKCPEDLTATKRASRYALRRGFQAWELIFDGQRAVVGDELGLRYVAVLLLRRPGTLVHGTTLAAQVHGRAVLPEGRLETEPSATTELIMQEARQWKAVLDDPCAPSSEKAKALDALEHLAQVRRAVERRPVSSAGKCVDAVRKAIHRLHENYAQARDRNGQPHAVLSAFAAHLQAHLLIPSSRYARHSASRRRAGVAGCFIYEPPSGVAWED